MLKSLVMAFSTYSRIPMPRIEWNEDSMRYSICFFPLVGAVIGIAEYLLLLLLQGLGFGNVFAAAVLTVCPLIITGGIHMDGFMDTNDALRSWKGREDRLRILKDPHLGAFAVIYGLIYMCLVFGAFSEISTRSMAVVSCGYVLSRVLSGLAVVTFPKAKKDGMLREEADASAKRVKEIMLFELAAAAAVIIGINPAAGGAAAAASALVFLIYYRMALSVFGGTTGDLAGWFVMTDELAVLLVSVTAVRL